MAITRITVRGARQHNLKNIDVEIPRNTLTVITGLSGSGKSSLAFDTIYAEGQRRYVETLSAYARQFLDQMERPDVDGIDGLSPSISIEQKTTSRSPRSTVGTSTEIYDYLRLLYSSIGVPHCPRCGREISRQSAEQIVARVMQHLAGNGGTPAAEERVMILSPIVRGRKGEFKKEIEKLGQHGFTRARIDGELLNLDEEIALDKRKNHTIEVMIDRLLVKPGIEKRLEQSVALAMKLAGGLVQVAFVGGEEQLYSARLACPQCGINVPHLEPRSFSFNSAYGACPECQGLGSRYDFDPAKIIIDWSKPLLDGGLGPGSSQQNMVHMLQIAAQAYGFDLSTPFEKLPDATQNLILYGPNGKKGGRAGFQGLLAHLKQVLDETPSESYREWLLNYMSATQCTACRGQRLRPESLGVRVNGMSISGFTALPVTRALEAAQRIKLGPREEQIAGRIVREVHERLAFLNGVGLGYISLDRSAATLSGGEGQRIRLATQIGSKLRGVLYVLDEPSIGLHHRDNGRLLTALEELRDLGNTVLVVEHDEETIRRADYVIDLGPGAGRHGGELVASGTPQQIMDAPGSLTGAYISGRSAIGVRHERRQPSGAIAILGAAANNLKHLDISFPLGVITVVTGVSGSGKSTLVNDILYRALARQLYRSREEPGAHKQITGADLIDKVIQIDQSPIGRSPRSNPATYTGVFTHLRDLYAMLPESRERGYKAGRFSFNVSGGRCEACQGEGQRRIEMNFLPDVYVLCEVCGGRRYNHETLAVRYKDTSIAELLETPASDALPLLENIPQIRQKLQTLVDVGLGYLHLGQSAVTLSGGEAQRIKLARELSKRQTGRTLYLLDEPTTGLHAADVARLLAAIHGLIDNGNTVITVEHDLDVIKVADWVVDLGPGSGADGGRVVAMGTPETISDCEASATGEALRGAHTAEALRHNAEALRHNAEAPRHDLESAVEQDVSPARHRLLDPIRLTNVTTHNLQHVDVEIPANRLTVITGVSGSGKSSLAFDTLFAEGQQRFADTFSTYARRFITHSSEAEFDEVSGLTPTIAISQRVPSRNPRSTVGTLTEIHDHYRLLFARAGIRFCPACNQALADATCPHCGFTGVHALTASMFSPNSEHGACPRCKGLGVLLDGDASKLVTDASRPLDGGAMAGHQAGRFYGDPHGQHMAILRAAGEALQIDFAAPWISLAPRARAIAMQGAGDRVFDVEWTYLRGRRTGVHRFQSRWPGLLAYLREEYERKHADRRGEAMDVLMTPVACDVCGGGGLKAEFLSVRFAGLAIHELLAKSVEDGLAFFEAVPSGPAGADPGSQRCPPNSARTSSYVFGDCAMPASRT